MKEVAEEAAAAAVEFSTLSSLVRALVDPRGGRRDSTTSRR